MPRPPLCCAAIFSSIVFVVLSHDAISEEAIARPIANERFNFRKGEKIPLPVTIYGDKHRLMLDTGCTGCVLDTQFRDRLGDVVKVEVAGTPLGLKNLEMFAAPDMLVGEKHRVLVRLDGVVACDPIQLTDDDSDIYHGVLGMQFLKSRVLRIHFDNSYAEFLSSASFDRDDGEKLHYKRGVPYVLARISKDGYQSFLIDTGSDAIIAISSEEFTRLLRKGRIVSTRPQIASTAATQVFVRTGILDSLEVGSFEFKNVAVEEADNNLMGLQFLGKFDLEMDFPNQTVFFRPGRRIDQPDRRDRAGFRVYRLKGKTLIGHVDADSAASAFGIEQGDEMQSVDAVAAVDFSLAEIHEKLSEPGAKRTLVLRRGGISRNVILPLENSPDPF